jgi:hypothetical protein
MGNFLRGMGVLVAAGLAMMTTAWAQTAEPPGRVGRLAYVNGTVSFHDRDETNWQPAAINYPLTSGDSLWTEPNGRAEVYVGGTRLRMQGNTQLETLALTDEQFQLRISQGRIDAKTVGLPQGQQVEILTPRGTVMLVGDGDYMIEAGTTEDATRVGVRAGSARVIASNGTELIVRAGEIGVLKGTEPPVFETVRMATPPMPPEWAARDRQLVTTQSVQYVPTGMTGVEELDYYGTWSTVGDYGRVWSPRTVPAGWAPYRQGRWRWVDPWGWTWIDDQPWGFAPSHYGRWVNHTGRWYWVPPERQARPVYAPAVVGFVDIAAAGAALAIGASVGQPVGWFPLGPREVYVPPYSADRAYIRRVNAAYVRDQAIIDRRIEYAERYRRDARFDDRRDDRRDGRPGDVRRDGRPGPGDDRDRLVFANQRFATVVPQQAFLRGDRVDRAAIRVDPARLARVQAAPVAAPTVAATGTVTTPPAEPGKAPAPDAKTPGTPAPGAAQPRADVQRAPLADIPVLGRPSRQDRPTTTAPGPQISRTQPAGQTAPGAAAPTERQLPNLRTRDGRETDRAAPTQAAPTAPAPAPAKPGEPPVAAPPTKPGEPAKPGEPPVAAPGAKPGEPAKPGDRPVATPPGKADDPAKPTQAAPARPSEPGKPGDKPGEPPKAAEPPKPPVSPPTTAEPPKPPVTPPKAAEPPKAPVVPPKAAEPPKPPVTPPKAAEPPKPPVTPPTTAEPPKPPVTPPKAAEPPKAPVAPPKAAEPPRQAPPPAQQAKPPEPPRPAPQAAPPQRPAPPPQQAAPPPQPKPQAPPPQQARPPAPPAPAPAAPPPQQAKPPAPPPQPQAAPPQQAKQPPGRDDDDRRR